MLRIIPRHVEGCGESSEAKPCPPRQHLRCPLWVKGTLNGKLVRRSLQTTNWQVAAQRVGGTGTLGTPDGLLFCQRCQQRHDHIRKHPGTVDARLRVRLPENAVGGELLKVSQRLPGTFPTEAVQSPEEDQIEFPLVCVLEEPLEGITV